MLHTIEVYFLLFISYGIFGWVLEVVGKLIELKRFVNRGFLIGPCCSIYGFGAILITILLQRFTSNVFILFCMSILVCGILEYFTSYFMEKIFKARWWDYSKRKFNINGRVCLNTIIPFGILGCFIMYVSNPFILGYIEKIPEMALHIIAGGIFAIYIIDNCISLSVVLNIRNTTKVVNKENREDNTEEITKKVKEILLGKSILNRRLINAYPKLTAIKDKIKESTEELKRNVNNAKEEIKDSIAEKKDNIKESIEETKKNIKNIRKKEK